ncbi:MaoC family dehydratase [Jatrophihabitans endophyticus]|uniref:MaoC family dehydratase n=1 Tax=Jatrophihabitans endophyticus TaxID=1206085 RepID=UPI0026E967BA|nr:MaoC family dehydratase [Jatrophihabitans endophyticus]
MDVATYRSVEDLEAAAGVELGPTDWFVMEQARIDTFADATEDHQWIHVDPQRAADGPFGTTIAHGFLTLSLVPYFANQLRDLENVAMGINYGLNKVRFPTPVPVGSRMRGRATLLSVERIDGGNAPAAQLVNQVSIEIENVAKPACVAEMVSRIYFAS